MGWGNGRWGNSLWGGRTVVAVRYLIASISALPKLVGARLSTVLSLNKSTSSAAQPLSGKLAVAEWLTGKTSVQYLLSGKSVKSTTALNISRLTAQPRK